jgi:5-methylcytosine-specific restriction endonuclease McrA
MDKKTHNRLIQAARKISLGWGPRKKAKEKCKVDKALFECSKCGAYIYEGKSEVNFMLYIDKYDKKEVRMERFDMDHIVPVIAVDSASHSWDVYYTRLFCGEENYRGLCQVCHKAKSTAENKIRYAIKYGKK